MHLRLVMMVKNEAHTLEKTIASAKPWIDSWCILDTGSTDGTQKLIAKALKGVRGKLHQGRFVDFSTTRNELLRLASPNRGPWLLLLDADDVLQGNPRPVVKYAPKTIEVFSVPVRKGIGSCASPRLIRAKAPWEYRGKVHEGLYRIGGDVNGARVVASSLSIDHEPHAISQEATKARWIRDLDVLRGEKDARSVFYYAWTLMWLGRYEEAIVAFEKRIAMNEGYFDEVVVSKLNLARCVAIVGPWQDAIDLYLQAYAADTRRAEALFDIATCYHHADRHVETIMFAKLATEKTPPLESLGVEPVAYEWGPLDLLAIHCFYVNDQTREWGRAAAQRCFEIKPNERTTKNLSFYLPSQPVTSQQPAPEVDPAPLAKLIR